MENARQHPWTSELNPRDGVTHLIVRDSGVENVAVLDRLRGNLYLRGNLTENVSNLTASGDSEFVVSDGTFVAAVIDEDGNLDLRGARSEASCGPVRQDLVDQYTDFGYDYFDDHFAPVACYKFVDDESYVNPGNLAFGEWSCQHYDHPDQDAPLGRAHAPWQWDETLSKMFQAVRDEYGEPITVTSGFRCPIHNEQFSTRRSKHAYGRAFDYSQGNTQANWDVALAGNNAEVNSERIFLYPQTGGGDEIPLSDFLANGWNPNNLPPGWTAITRGHIDSGEPEEEQY